MLFSTPLERIHKCLLGKNCSRNITRVVCELFVVDRCFDIAHRTGYELFLLCNCGWLGWHCSFRAFYQVLGWVFGEGWTRGSEVEACRVEYQFFVLERWTLEWSSTSSHPDRGNILSFCSGQSGFRAPQLLCNLCVVSNHGCSLHSRIVCFGQGTMMFQCSS